MPLWRRKGEGWKLVVSGLFLDVDYLVDYLVNYLNGIGLERKNNSHYILNLPSIGQ